MLSFHLIVQQLLTLISKLYFPSGKGKKFLYLIFQFRYLLLDQKINIMISRVIPFFNSIMPGLIRTQLYCFSTQSFRVDRSHAREVLKLEKCVNLREVMTYITENNDEFKMNQGKETFKKMLKLRHTAQPWENLVNFSKNIENIDISRCDTETLGYMCALVPLLSQNYSFNHKTFSQIFDKITEALNNPNEISNETILNFIEAAYEADKRPLVPTLVGILKQRIPKLKYKDFSRFIEILSKRKFPSIKQKELMTDLSEKILADMQNLESRTVIECYRYLKPMNHRIWPIEKLLNQLEENIKGRLDDLDEREIHNLLQFKGQLNIFQRAVLKKILNSIDENGQSSIDELTFFKLFKKIDFDDNTKITGENEAKLLKFLIDNLKTSNQVIQILQRDILPRQSVLKLVEKISESEFSSKYEKNYNYVYEVVSRGIFKDDNFKQFVDQLKKQYPRTNLGYRFLSSALIASRLAVKDPKNPEFREIHEYFKKAVLESGKNNGKTFQSGYYSHSNKLFENFNRKYGYLILENFVNEYSQPDKKIANSLLNYLFLSKNTKDTLRIIKKNKNAFTLNQVCNILKKVNSAPSEFQGKHEFLCQILTHLITPEITNQDRKQIMNYLCNWEIQLSLNSSEMGSFLRLAQAYVKNSGQNLNYQYNFASYFISSPCTSLRANPQYVHLLEQMQQKISIDQTDKFFKSSSAFIEMARLNVLSKKTAERLLKNDSKSENHFLYQYANVICGNKPEITEPIKQNSLLLIVRSRQLKDEDIDAHIGAINDIIEKLKINEIENLLINFSMMKTQKTLAILEHLISRYAELSKFSRNKLYYVLQNLQKVSYQSSKYRELLKIHSELLTKNMGNVSLPVHQILLKECIKNKVDCQEYSKKLTQFVQGKFQFSETNFKEISGFVESFLLADFEQAFKLFQSNYKYFYGSHKKALIDIFVVANLKDQKIKEDILKFFRANKDLQIHQGTFRYLSANIPELKDLESSLKTVSANQNWMREALVQFLTSNNIAHTVEEKYGEKLVKIDDKFVTFSQIPFSEISVKKLQEYNSVNFGIPEDQSKNVIILFLSKRKTNKRKILNLLSGEIPSLKDHRSNLNTALNEAENKSNRASSEAYKSRKASWAEKQQKNKAQNKNQNETEGKKQKVQEKQQKADDKKEEKSEWQA